ncbi:sporulation related protein [Neolewinella xylanilytica]|uniref:Sporulation related protein n=1 Tax=Neolewinella xylanilytica TaxID=1514080 RepID=A0A2S6I8G8_9BACT|nr:SPOR domain-containing protein [Neolewinella xylanilytica]PPK87785.1 sporulation related protein [Neolewinella xylanilytica]
MKKTSILIPLILVVCLIALALLVSRAIAASEQSQTEFEDKTNRADLPTSRTGDSLAIADGQADTDPMENMQPKRFQDLVPANSRDSSVTAMGSAGVNFLVIAGAFRQEINARTRIRNLREAGFSRTTLENFDRGTYAVALVDRTGSYGEATEMADRVRQAGFEVEVYRKR